MWKIKDRLLLGVVAGLGANIIKNAIGASAKRKRWAEINGVERAAGMLVPPHTLASKEGKVVGYIADNIIERGTCWPSGVDYSIWCFGYPWCNKS